MPGKEERIRARAYELWEREGGSHGSHERHWLEATRQVEAELAGDAAPAAGAAPKPAKKASVAKAPAKREPKPKAAEMAPAPRAARTAKPKTSKPV